MSFCLKLILHPIAMIIGEIIKSCETKEKRTPVTDVSRNKIKNETTTIMCNGKSRFALRRDEIYKKPTTTK